MEGIDIQFTQKACKLLYSKLMQAIKIHDYTVQLGDALNRNDMVSADLFINMRQDAMMVVDAIDGEIESLIYSMPEELQPRMAQLMSKDWTSLILKNEGEGDVCKQYDRVRRQFEKTMEIDRILNTKVCGSESYYNNTKSV